MRVYGTYNVHLRIAISFITEFSNSIDSQYTNFHVTPLSIRLHVRDIHSIFKSIKCRTYTRVILPESNVTDDVRAKESDTVKLNIALSDTDLQLQHIRMVSIKI